MRILYASDAPSIHTRRWAEAFRDAGAEVHVASFRAADIPGVTVHRLSDGGIGKAGYLLAVPALRRLWSRLRPDVVHAQYVTSYGFLAAAARLRPRVVTAWGTDVLVSPQQSALSRWLARRALTSADLVTTVAEHMVPVVAALGAPAGKALAIPFGVDTQLFRPPALPRGSGRLRVISTRNFAAVYDVATVVEAVARLAARDVAVELDLVGAGPLRPALEQQVDRSGLRARTCFHGHVDHPRLVSLLGAADLFVSSAVSDGNNVSLNEAMACGCFPIATDIPANREWISDGRNGLLFPGGEAARLADAITRAANEPALRQAAALENRRIVEQRADWRRSVARMGELYRQLAEGRR